MIIMHPGRGVSRSVLFVMTVLLTLLTFLPLNVYSHLDPPGNPPIRVEVKLLDIELLSDQDDGLNGETELIVKWTLAHSGHFLSSSSKTREVPGILTITGLNYDYSDLRSKSFNKIMYSHVECTPMSPIFMNAEFIEDDTDTITQILSGIAAAGTGLAATLVSLGGGSALIVASLASGSALSNIINLAASINGNDYLGEASIIINSPGKYRLESDHVAMNIEVTVTPAVGEGSCDIPRGVKQVTTPRQVTETVTSTITAPERGTATVTYTTTVEKTTTITITTLISETTPRQTTSPQITQTPSGITITYEEVPGLTTSTTIDPLLLPLIEKSQKELEKDIEKYKAKDREYFKVYKSAINMSMNIMPEEGNPGGMILEQVDLLRRSIPVKILLESLDPLVLEIANLASATSTSDTPLDAIRYLSKAREDVASERYINAVDSYRLAWEKSLEAILASRCPCIEARTGISTLSVNIVDESMNPVEGVIVDVYGNKGLILTTISGEKPKTLTLEPGDYIIKASIEFLGRQFTVGSTSLSLREPTEVTVVVSSILVPVAWIPVVSDGIAGLLASIIAYKLYQATRPQGSARAASLAIAAVIGIMVFALLRYII
ncbi:MAG: hypothetical protein GSR85_01335 [Desulfurococcales archaeon]|nr:hypothetical protein [Desulfurococcales archaeon]